MSTPTSLAAREDLIYPDSDGEPMSDNTLQFQWIVTIQGGLDALFRDDPDVFVAGDLLWYPVEGDNATRTAPDALVVFGRPKGYRGSYMQWREGGIAPQVVFEVTSPGNRPGKLAEKFRFYERFGVEEYYMYDPDEGELSGWLRDGPQLRPIAEMRGWVSARMGVRFDLNGTELSLERPDGRPILSYIEIDRRAEDAEQRAENAEQRAEDAEQRAEAARRRAESLAARLRALGIDPDE